MSEFYHQHNQLDYHINNPTFIDVLNLRFDLENQRFTTINEAIEYIQPEVQSINHNLKEAELIGKKVTLSGEAIDIVLPELDEESKTVQAIQYTVQAGDDPESDYPPVSGYLSGITARTILQPDGTHVPELRCRIMTHSSVSIGLFAGNLFADGNMATSQLEFVEDRNNRIFINALNALADATHDEQTALTTAHIHDLLTPEEESELFDPYRLRKIGHAVRSLEKNRGVDMAYRDGIIDLVGSRLGVDSTTSFSVAAISVCIRNSDGTIDLPKGRVRDSLQFINLEFAPYHWRSKGAAIKSEDEETLSLVTYASLLSDADDTLKPLYIPLEKLEVFYPES